MKYIISRKITILLLFLLILTANMFVFENYLYAHNNPSADVNEQEDGDLIGNGTQAKGCGDGKDYTKCIDDSGGGGSSWWLVKQKKDENTYEPLSFDKDFIMYRPTPFKNIIISAKTHHRCKGYKYIIVHAYNTTGKAFPLKGVYGTSSLPISYSKKYYSDAKSVGSKYVLDYNENIYSLGGKKTLSYTLKNVNNNTSIDRIGEALDNIYSRHKIRNGNIGHNNFEGVRLQYGFVETIFSNIKRKMSLLYGANDPRNTLYYQEISQIMGGDGTISSFCFDEKKFTEGESKIKTKTVANIKVNNSTDKKKNIKVESQLDSQKKQSIELRVGESLDIDFEHYVYLEKATEMKDLVNPPIIKDLDLSYTQSILEEEGDTHKSFSSKKESDIKKYSIGHGEVPLSDNKGLNWSESVDRKYFKKKIPSIIENKKLGRKKDQTVELNSDKSGFKIKYDDLSTGENKFCKQVALNVTTAKYKKENGNFLASDITVNPREEGKYSYYTFSSICVTITKKGGDPIAFHTRTRPIISSDKPGSIYEGDHFTGWSNFDAGKNVKVKIADNEKITVKFRYLAYSPYSGDLLEKAKAQGKIEEIKYLTNINRVPTSNNGSKPFTPLNPKTGNNNIDWYNSTIALKSHKNLFKTTYNYDTLYSRRIPGKGGGELSGANDFESKAEEVVGNEMSPGQETKICGYTALNIRSLSFLPDTVKSSDKGEGIKFDKRVDNFSNGNAYYSYACVTIIKQGPPPPETMCQNIADTTQDQGNTGVASLVRNISRGQDYWPSINGINRTNPASSVRASIAGGKSGATNSTGFIYARPFDNIQFKHYLCYGFHAVTSSAIGYKSPRIHKDRRVIEYDIFSEVNGKSAPYLFGETFKDGEKDLVRIDSMGNLDKMNSTINDDNVIRDSYGVSIESPTALNSRYNQCEEPEGNGLGPLADGYALPGKSHPCGSVNGVVGNKKVGKAIYQHVKFPNNQVWTGKADGEEGGKEKKANWIKINDCSCHNNTIGSLSEKATPKKYGERKRISYYYEKDGCIEKEEKCCSAGYDTETYNCKCKKTGKKDKDGKDIEECSTCTKSVCKKEETPSNYEHYGPGNNSASELKDYVSSDYVPDNERYFGSPDGTSRPEDSGALKESEDPIKYMQSKKDHRTEIGVKIPYNFRVTYDEKIKLPGREADIVYAGEILQSPEVKVTVHARPNPDVADQEYATITPRIKTRLLTFTVAPKVEYNSIKKLLTGSVEKYNTDNDNLCRSSFKFANHDKCKTHDTDWLNNDRYLNPEGKYKGEEEKINTPTISVPDVEIGTKFCVAHAIWPADSHGLPYDDQKEVPHNREDLQNRALEPAIARGKDSYWRVSEPVCRTIAKKPTTHVHGGSIEAKGTESSTTSKIIGVGFKQNPSASKLTHFGSFTDQNIISNDKVIGTGSGASFGYYLNDSPKENNEKLSLPGGNKKDPSINEHFCKHYGILTISKDCNNGRSGYANIDRNTEIINNLYSRYTGHDSSASVSNINSIEPCPNDDAIGDCLKSNDTRYILADNDAKISQLNLNHKASKDNEYVNNTYVIDASGKTININGDICIGSCYDTTVYKGSEEVPQLLIFADNINISGNVKRIDAWLIADKNINTCAKFDKSTIQSAISFSNRDKQKCTNQLVINGPVFSRNGRIELNRTAGTYSGRPPDNNDSRILGWPSKPSFNLNNDGPITPAEIINLRADAYIWAFAQAQRLTQAQVVYRRELPVRY